MAANIIKKPGPPVPPRPQHTTSTTTSLIATSLRTISVAATTPTTPTTTSTSTFTTNSQNNGSIVTKTNNHSQTITSFIKTTTNNSSINKNEENTTTTTNNNSNHKQNPPIIHKKPIMTRQTSQSGAGRTVIYKSPTISMQQRQEQISNATGVGGVTSETNSTSVSMRNTSSAIVAPKPPLKLRKAPDVPKSQQQQQQLQNQTQTNNISLNRHNSMGCTGSPKTSVGLKETRLSLGRADLDKFGKIQLNQLQLSSQPLPKPRKIVQMPVATMDMEDKTTTTSTTSKTNSMANIFRRSKTSLDNSLNSVSGNGSTMGNLSSPNRFLSGKTVEIKNNLRNAAERLFAEIIVSQHNKHATEPTPTIITKHERAIQHTTTMIPQKQQQQYQQQQSKQHKLNTVTVAVNTSPDKANVPNSNYTRICINANSPATTPTTPLLNGTDSVTKFEKKKPIESLFNSPEKKQAFHEILISELAAMRTRSSSMENLQTNCNNENNNHQIEDIVKNSIPQNQLESVQSNTRLRCNSVEEFDEDQDDVDVDVDPNTDISNMDEDLLRKKLKLGNKHASRKRCPSGCSSDSSPYGTERSARIRTSDWVEVQDNGKQVTLTSCHISLEDSGLEDEERLDDISTSGVGDSWDSVKETHNEQRLRNIKRGMSISDLPPLPKSLSGINQMLVSDSGLLSDADVISVDNNLNNSLINESDAIENHNNNNNDNQMDNQKENKTDFNTKNNILKNNIKNIDNNKNNTTTILADSNGNKSELNNSPTTTNLSSMKPMSIGGSTLDTQLATLKKEMYGLRQLDLSLLSQLWALNDSIQEFRSMLQEQEQEQEQDQLDNEAERDLCLPHSTGPSSYDSESSEGDEDVITAKRNLGAIPKIITTQPKLTNNGGTLIPTTTAEKPLRPPLPKALETKPVPRMRSAPPPPPVNRKAVAPPRPT